MTPEFEKRSYPVGLEVRQADGESRTVKGLAAVYNSRSEKLGWFTEMIEPGAFTDALKNSDVRAFFNHDWNHLLGREKSNTLRLKETERGLEFELDIPESRQDILELVERGDLDECSFRFKVTDQAWEERQQPDGTVDILRKIKKVDPIVDVTLATFGAYKDTSVAKRCYDEYRSEHQEQSEEGYDTQAHQRRERELFILENS